MCNSVFGMFSFWLFYIHILIYNNINITHTYIYTPIYFPYISQIWYVQHFPMYGVNYLTCVRYEISIGWKWCLAPRKCHLSEANQGATNKSRCCWVVYNLWVWDWCTAQATKKLELNPQTPWNLLLGMRYDWFVHVCPIDSPWMI